MKLNCDLGESFGAWVMGQDAEVMPHIDMANVACGFHAGDADVMYQTLALAKENGVVVGAHPGYQDIPGFGRRSLKLDQQQLINAIVYQVGALTAMAKMHGLDVEYVKPHGAMYNDMMKNKPLRNAIMEAVSKYPSNLKLMLQATGKQAEHKLEAKSYNIELMFEAFADRAYTDEGLLVARSQPGAVLTKENTLSQITQLVRDSSINSTNGKLLKLQVDSICVHGDNLSAVEAIKDIQQIIKGH